MSYISRTVEKTIGSYLFQGKVIIIHGARQCGKTTLVKHLVEQRPEKALWFSGDDYQSEELFARMSLSRWRQILGSNKLVIIDEAQNIPELGRAVKLLVDADSSVQVILTGSSSFQLANKTEEPLTGRKYEFNLFPFSFAELCAETGFAREYQWLEDRLLYGSYPEVINNPDRRHEHLMELSDSYLYRDLFKYDGMRKSSVLKNLVKALALQVGSEVSVGELSQLLSLSRPTVETYLGLLEEAFVVFSLPSYSRNVRNEIKKGRKIYFWDTGIRNAVLNNFLPLPQRQDVGALWENYLVSERLKFHKNNQRFTSVESFFWRTTQQQEIDYLEDQNGTLTAWEFKWGSRRQAKFPLTFSRAYPKAQFAQINRDNYDEFLSQDG